MKHWVLLVGVIGVAVWHGEMSSTVAGPLVELGRPGPWAGVSGLIAYGPRLYLVNSQLFVNHNAADVYSYHPGEGTLRFERRLFSQDAGIPAIIDGLLYWPYEDPRFSSTYGEYAITDGQKWQWQVAPDLRGFHVHALTAHQGVLYALVSGWRGRIYQSRDHGQRWTLLYEHPSPAGQVSRITAMVAGADTLYFALTAWAEAGVKLLHRQGAAVVPVPGWPSGRSIGALGVFQGKIYAVNHTADTQRLWRSDGRRSPEPIAALDGYSVRALAATADTLWAVSAAPGGKGIVWRSADGLKWRQVQRLPAPPVALTVVGDQVFVGTYNRTRGGALWGPAPPHAFATLPPPAQLPAPSVHPFTPSALAHALHELDQALADSTRGDYRQRLITHLLPLALSHDPAAGQALSRRLYTSLPPTLVPLFGGQVQMPMAQLVRWYLLYAIALNGHGWVPPACLTTPWTASPNMAEKYLEPVLAAAWAVTELGQATPATLDALHIALAAELPTWARGDVLAALHRLAGHPFQYPAPSLAP
jgi:hypothetical protein